jgi:membrane protein implicated in regulation of membrane protease activity
MTRRTRKFIGTFVLILIVPIYAMLMVELSRYMLAGASWWIQAIFFLIAGLGWALPVLPLIKWMERLGPNEEAQERR